MKKEFTLTRSFPIDSERLFQYFTEAELIEQWAYPEGMTLHIPQFEAHSGGRYRYEHQSSKGLYKAVGHIEEFVPGKKLVQVDETGKSPDGELMFENLKCIIEFSDKGGETEIKLTQKGFKEDKTMNECREGWVECFEHLTKLIEAEAGMSKRPSSSSDDVRPQV